MFDSTSSYIDFQSSQTKNNTHTFTYLTPFKKPRVETSSQIESTRLQQKTEKVNFSNFSIPAVFLKSTHQEKESKAIASKKFQQQKPLTELLSTLDEHSEAADRPNSASGIREKRKASDINVYNEPASSSTCSLEASNDPNFSFRDHEGNYDSQYLSDVSGNYKPLAQTQDTTISQHSHVLDTRHTFNMMFLCYSSLLSFGLMLQNEEETSENMLKEKPAHSVKRSYKNAKSHNLTERKRRDKINEQIHRLKELIPNCNKRDKASMLDDAIDYLKTLKLQLQIMTMGRGLCMPLNHLMMLPAHHMNMNMNMNMNAQHLMGFRPQVQFPIPQMSNGVTDNNNIRVQMFGFSNQLPPPISIHNAPFMLPVIGNSSTAPTSFGNQNQPSRTCG